MLRSGRRHRRRCGSAFGHFLEDLEKIHELCTNSILLTAHLEENFRRLAAADCPFTVNHSQWYPRDSFVFGVLAELVHLCLQLIGFQELDSLVV